jgi:iron complex transport system substrate-binding protein
MSVGKWLVLAIVLPALAACTETAVPVTKPVDAPRLVSLAPNLTELVYAAGAGDALVGVSAYSDYPPAAGELPVIGDAFAFDREQLALLAPDILLVWQSGTPAHVIDELRLAGFTVEVLRTRSLADVATSLRRIGKLTRRQSQAESAAIEFMRGLDELRQRFADAADISVFYQISKRPLYTVNGEHYVSELITLCGGTNIFADLDALAPTVAVEAVVASDPEIMLASDDKGPDAFAEWSRWPAMIANRYGNHFLIPADEVGRATPRVLGAGQAICEALAEGRLRREAADKHVR